MTSMSTSQISYVLLKLGEMKMIILKWKDEIFFTLQREEERGAAYFQKWKLSVHELDNFQQKTFQF